MVDEQHAVDMVDLMLQAGGEQPLCLDFLRLQVEIEKFHFDGLRPLDLLVVFRDRQTALFVSGFLVGCPNHLWIDEDLRFLRLVFLGEIYCDHAPRDANLNGGKTDTGRRVHRLEHVLDERTQRMADLNARVLAMGDLLARAQSQLQQTVHERLDAVTARLGDSMRTSTKDTTEHLQQLHARLAVIDSAQKNITDLASQVTSLQNVLANKQTRGAFGQSRMEMIIQDGLPKDCYEFQATLTNNARPDCVVHLPDGPSLVIDAKFPLEAVTAFREAKSDDDRKLATARVRTDIAKHVGDIAAKYLIPGETQDMALMFVPSESVYA